MLDQLSEWEGTAAALVWLRNYCPNEERSWFHCQEKAFGDVGVLCVEEGLHSGAWQKGTEVGGFLRLLKSMLTYIHVTCTQITFKAHPCPADKLASALPWF